MAGATVKSVSFTWNKEKLNMLDRRVKEGVFAIAYDIAAQARRNAPVVTSALRNSLRVEDDATGKAIYIKAGGIVAQGTAGARKVDYAYKREMGPNRNPATEHYLENAQRAVMSGEFMKKYFGEICK